MVAVRHQAWLSANDFEGKWPTPVFLPVRMLLRGYPSLLQDVARTG
jgi:hypothetical protein